MLFNVSDFKDSYKDELEKYRSMLPGTITDFRGFITGAEVLKYFSNLINIIDEPSLNVSDLQEVIPDTSDITCTFRCSNDLEYEFSIYDGEKIFDVNDDSYIYKTIRGTFSPSQLNDMLTVFSWGGNASGYAFIGLKDSINTDCPSDVGLEEFVITREIHF